VSAAPGWENGWEPMNRRHVSVEREKGFEPSTSTLARWVSFLLGLVNRRLGRSQGALARPSWTLVGHRGVGRRVGGGHQPPDSDEDVFAPLRKVAS